MLNFFLFRWPNKYLFLSCSLTHINHSSCFTFTCFTYFPFPLVSYALILFYFKFISGSVPVFLCLSFLKLYTTTLCQNLCLYFTYFSVCWENTRKEGNRWKFLLKGKAKEFRVLTMIYNEKWLHFFWQVSLYGWISVQIWRTIHLTLASTTIILL